jgi:hypothetical protein
MSPASGNEQYERWQPFDCVHCRCPNCGSDRLLPGRRDDAAAICRDCAGITRNFFCDRCSFEGLLLREHLCKRCTLTGRTLVTFRVVRASSP